MIPVPVGHSHEAVIEGKCEKHVTCEYCHRDFVYVLTRQGVGNAFNLLDIRSDRAIHAVATKRAEKILARALLGHNLVACPGCGWYQATMVRQFKQRRFLALVQVGTFLALYPIVVSVCIFIFNPWLLAVTAGGFVASCLGATGLLLVWN